MDCRDIIGWIRYDRSECLGPERNEMLIANLGVILAGSHGARIDVFDILACQPWGDWERPAIPESVIIEKLKRGLKR